ncbi:hypothetical protein Xbud_02131 [Xenorhabdus budapestensis]|uniref:Uncharacterized protein n=1 Tax=Xenorhabdus budapestensis TaxID=290110 RepID=A0A2D0IZX5_XENBU|nr:hypothetical protein Xbud_02131 [Xenorhabdus budapestensis]
MAITKAMTSDDATPFLNTERFSIIIRLTCAHDLALPADKTRHRCCPEPVFADAS